MVLPAEFIEYSEGSRILFRPIETTLVAFSYGR